MNAWYYFWMANFFVAGSAFAVITVIVLVRGLGDLREMFADLRKEARSATMIATHFSSSRLDHRRHLPGATLATGLYGRRFVGGICRLSGRRARIGNVSRSRHPGRHRDRHHHLHVLRRAGLQDRLCLVHKRPDRRAGHDLHWPHRLHRQAAARDAADDRP